MMELPSQEGEMPIPINSSTTYGGGHGNGHGHGHGHGAAQHNQMMSSSSNGMQQEEGLGGYNNKKVVRYRECLKNHAAAMGGNATDGCGEFMPSGEEGTIEALNCSACNCHRNFHRKEVEGDPTPLDFLHTHTHRSRKFPLALPYPTPTGNILPSRTVPPHHHHMNMIMPYNIGPLPSESDEHEEAAGGGIVQARPTQLVKKRFRTKFTQEQKDKMFNFADKVGWKIQKQEESVVQQFCQEIGVKRRVLKVWMHNNKHNLSKQNPPSQPSIN